MIKISDIRKATEMRIRGSGSDFDWVFHRAVNAVIRDLILDTMLVVREYDPDDTPPEAIDLPSKYAGVFYEGVPLWMQRMAKWARQQTEEVSDALYRRELAKAQGESINDARPEVGYEYTDED